jgi:hypothetical protein
LCLWRRCRLRRRIGVGNDTRGGYDRILVLVVLVMVLMVLMMVLMVVWAVHGGGGVDVG